jgi:aminoglycoside phosphotransferase (APT) family kinase protein
MSNAASEAPVLKQYIGFEVSRDIDDTRRRLGEWLKPRTPGASAVDVLSLSKPKGNGGSTELYFAELEVTSAGERRRLDYVLRFKPFEPRMFYREHFAEQQTLVRFLHAETDVPVPAILFYEPDPAPLGAPFWIMERLYGDVPPDSPPFNITGFVFDASLENRRKVWASGLEAATRMAKVDVSRMPEIIALRPGESGMEENLRNWTQAMHWACDGEPTPLLRKANEWLWANMPARKETALSHGDCRIGNMMFRDYACIAVLDWDTITLAGPQLDLAHWLVMDEYFTEGLGLPPLPGIGGREETIAEWERLMGRPADQLGWHEVLASFRLEINCIRGLLRMPKEAVAAMLFEDGGTVMTQQLRKVLDRVAGI